MRRDTFVYKVIDGCALHADVYRPDDDLSRPTLVWLHGGALILGSRAGLDPAQRDRYLDAGFGVVAIDYRLAPETRLPAIVEDLRDAFAWLRARGPALAQLDPDRLAVVGHSAGGYLALLSGAVIRPRPRALVSFYGYGDIVGDWYRRPDPFYCRQPPVSEAEARAAVGDRPLADAAGPAAQARQRFYLWCRQQGRWPVEVVGADPTPSRRPSRPTARPAGGARLPADAAPPRRSRYRCAARAVGPDGRGVGAGRRRRMT